VASAGGTNWSREEVEATVSDYLRMLHLELVGQPYNKRAHNRALQRQLPNRSAGAIELKHANISSALMGGLAMSRARFAASARVGHLLPIDGTARRD